MATINLDILNQYANGETPTTPVSETPATPEKPKRERKQKPASEPATEQTVTLTKSALEQLVANAVQQAVQQAMASVNQQVNQQVVATPTTQTTQTTTVTQTTPEPAELKIPTEVKRAKKAFDREHWVNNGQGNKFVVHNDVLWNLVKLEKGAWIAKAVQISADGLSIEDRVDIAQIAFKYTAELEKTWGRKLYTNPKSE